MLSYISQQCLYVMYTATCFDIFSCHHQTVYNQCNAKKYITTVYLCNLHCYMFRQFFMSSSQFTTNAMLSYISQQCLCVIYTTTCFDILLCHHQGVYSHQHRLIAREIVRPKILYSILLWKRQCFNILLILCNCNSNSFNLITYIRLRRNILML
jgi:hypothetical protein